MAGTRWALFLLLSATSVGISQQSSAPTPADSVQSTQPADQDHPALSHRPSPSPAQGQIKLDVLVTDATGRPVAGLQQGDFTLLDDKKPQPILFFHATDGSIGQGAAEPPVEVILLIDATNNSLRNVAFERDQIAKFLRQNGGRLAQPLTLMIFSEQGVVQAGPRPSSDGNLVAQELDKSGATMHTVPRSGGYDAIERVELSLKTLRSIIAAEAPKPGRKMLIWIGPGWPMLQNPGYRASDDTQRALFNAVVETTRMLREVRITVYNVNQVDPSSAEMTRTDFYKNFLKGVPSPRQAESGDLSLPVFAIHSGGLVLNTTEDLVSQLNRCVAEAKAYYTVGFDPSKADHTDEYHELEVQISKPGMKVRTNAGYYGEPAFKP